MRVIATVIAVLSGLAVLAGYFLTPFIPALAAVQSQLLTAAMTLAGVAVLAGVFNLVSVHTEKCAATGRTAFTAPCLSSACS